MIKLILKLRLTDGTGEINIKDLLLSRVATGYINDDFYNFGLEKLSEELRKKLEIETTEYNKELIEFFVVCFNEKIEDQLFNKLHNVICSFILNQIKFKFSLSDKEVFFTDDEKNLKNRFSSNWFKNIVDENKSRGLTYSFFNKIPLEWIDILVIKTNGIKILKSLVDKKDIRKTSKKTMSDILLQEIKKIINESFYNVESISEKIMEDIIRQDTNLKKIYECNNNSLVIENPLNILNDVGFSFTPKNNKVVFNNELLTIENFVKFLKMKGF